MARVTVSQKFIVLCRQFTTVEVFSLLRIHTQQRDNLLFLFFFVMFVYMQYNTMNVREMPNKVFRSNIVLNYWNDQKLDEEQKAFDWNAGAKFEAKKASDCLLMFAMNFVFATNTSFTIKLQMFMRAEMFVQWCERFMFALNADASFFLRKLSRALWFIENHQVPENGTVFRLIF